MKKPALLLALLQFAPVVRASDFPRTPTFATDVEMVRLNVSVLNSRERFVTDLSADDFVVFENGVRQNLTLFEPKDVPLSLVMLVDMSASMAPKLKATIRAASRLVQSLGPHDEASIITFNQRLTVLQDATSDQGLLLEALGRAQADGPTALHNALYVTIKDLRQDEKQDKLRRRAIVLLSDGQDTTSVVSDDQVMAQARAAQLSVYTILLSGSGEAVNPGAQYFMTALAHETGGNAFFIDEISELRSVYERIAQELHSQYCLGYVSSGRSPDGNWRQILVLTPQREKLRVRHRVGYYAGSRATSKIP